MTRFVGIKNDQIHLISDIKFQHPTLEIVELPEEFEDIDSEELIANYELKHKKIINKLERKAAKNLRIALVSNWKMRCGIAIYAEKLWREVIPHVGDFKLFIERQEFIEPVTNIKDITISADQVVACWSRGESLQELVSEITKYDPDIIWIQHEFGIWPNARYWLAMLTQLSKYRVIVTMHSVFHHKDKTIIEAAIPEIVVHLDAAKEVLKTEKGVPGVIYTVPHGCDPCTDKGKLWNFYKSEQTFLQFGFGFRYKGWENSIRATAILKQKYPNVFFTGLFSESAGNKMEHFLYYNELIRLIKELGLEDNVALIKSYQSDDTLNSYIRTNQASVFPYVQHPEHEVFGVSGAARYVMAKGVPVITSSGNHFSDLPTIKADTPEEIAAELDNLFSDWKLKDKQIEVQLEYLKENSWENVAQQYIKIFES
jgi:glycosyltransferase involved in cell wall biosynthesis